MDNFVQDVRAALPDLVEDARLAPMTPPETPPQSSTVADSCPAEAPISNKEWFRRRPQPGNSNVCHIGHDPASNKNAVPTRPSPPPSSQKASQAEPNIPLLVVQAHSLTLQTRALRDSLALLNASYDLLDEENTILRRRQASQVENIRQKDLAIDRLRKSKSRLQRDSSFRKGKLHVRIRESKGQVGGVGGEADGGAKVEHGKEGSGAEGGMSAKGEQEADVEGGQNAGEESADLEFEPALDTESSQANANAHDGVLAIPVLTSILLDVLAVGLVEGVVYFWQWQGRRM